MSADRTEKVAPWVLFGDTVAASVDGRMAWPELLAAGMPAASPWGGLINLSDRANRGFGDTVRGLGRVALDRRARKPVGHVFVAMSYLDGRHGKLPPADAAMLGRLAVRHASGLVGEGSSIFVIGPTGAGLPATEGEAPPDVPAGFGGYYRWVGRIDEAMEEAIGGPGEPDAYYVSLKALPRKDTTDGIRLRRSGMEWVCRRLVCVVLGGGKLQG